MLPRFIRYEVKKLEQVVCNSISQLTVDLHIQLVNYIEYFSSTIIET
jgi:hypothetical protein